MIPAKVNKGTALALLCSVQFMVVLDNAIGNVALPSIRDDLGFSDSGLQYVISLYALTFGGLLVLGGRAGDLFGRRRVFMLGTALFGTASLLCGLAESETMLLAGRAAQGVGAAFVSPTALSLIATLFAEGRERNRAMGVWGAVAASGAAAGLIVGGVLTETLGWAWCFFVNVPIAAAALALTPRLLPESRGERTSLDLPGAVLVTAGLGLLVYGVTRGQEDGFGSATASGLLGAAALLLLAFVAVERRTRVPLVPFAIFANRGHTAADVGSLLMAAVIAGQSFFLTLYMQQVLDYSAIQTGLAFLPISLMAFVGSALASQLVGRVRAPSVLATGLVALSTACAYLTRIDPDGSYVTDLLPAFALFGIGLGLAFVSATIAATSGVAASDQGLASGLLSSSQQLGFAIGIAVLASVAVGASESSAAADPALRLLDGFRAGLWAAAAIALAGAVASLTVAGREPTTRGETIPA